MNFGFNKFLIIIAALVGAQLAWYIHRKKSEKRPLVCPLHSDCEAVVHSDFSRFFGVPVETLGFLYYGLIALSYLLLLSFKPLASLPLLGFGLLTATTLAFLFSVYLTFIQAFALKQWCTWCLLSAALCTIIFGLALAAVEFSPIALLARYHGVLVLIHLVGITLGVGGATIADIFFFRFLKDFRISHEEAAILRTLSQIIWVALAVLALTGVGLYLPEASILNQTPKFLVKAIAVGVIILNGAFLNLVIAPKLTTISFGGRHHHEAGELHHLRRLAFALGAVSIVSWYAALVLGSLPKDLTISFGAILSIYASVLAGVIIISQLVDRYFSRLAADE